MTYTKKMFDPLRPNAEFIDIPVGLPENAAPPDREARKYLPTGRKPSIFQIPCRQAVNIAEYAKASAENQRYSWEKVNQPVICFF
jgi:predicted RNase H-like nuclease